MKAFKPFTAGPNLTHNYPFKTFMVSCNVECSDFTKLVLPHSLCCQWMFANRSSRWSRFCARAKSPMGTSNSSVPQIGPLLTTFPFTQRRARAQKPLIPLYSSSPILGTAFTGVVVAFLAASVMFPSTVRTNSVFATQGITRLTKRPTKVQNARSIAARKTKRFCAGMTAIAMSEVSEFRPKSDIPQTKGTSCDTLVISFCLFGMKRRELKGGAYPFHIL